MSRAYLAAFAFTASTLLGALCLLAIMYVVGARWFVVFRRLCESVVAVLPALPLFFVPVLLKLRELYPWARADEPGLSAVTHHRAMVLGHAWLGAEPFVARAAVYLAAWLGLAAALRGAALAAETGRTPWLRGKERSLSGLGLPLLGFSGTFATFDWVSSAVPAFNMTSAGMYFLTGGFAAAVGLLSVLVHVARRRALLPPSVGGEHSSALGRLLLSAICLWAYLAVCQLIIAFSANLPREAAFYRARATGGWQYLTGLLLLGHFLVPFILLLSRATKRRTGFVAAIGGWTVTMHACDVYWLVVPSATRSALPLDFAPFLLLAGLSATLGWLRFDSRRPLPSSDPALARSLGYRSS